MPTMRASMLAVLAVLSSSVLATAQPSPKTDGGPTQQRSSGPPKIGSCVVTHADRSTVCTPNIDEGGCRAHGLETRSPAVWTAGQGCS